MIKVNRHAFAFGISMFVGLAMIINVHSSKAQCSGAWSQPDSLDYLCANGPFLQYFVGDNACPTTAQTTFTFSAPIRRLILTFSAFGTTSYSNQSRMAVFLNNVKIDLALACKIELDCQPIVGDYVINSGCLADLLPGSDGGISGYIYLEADAFGFTEINSIGVAVSEPLSSGTIFRLDSCYVDGKFECGSTGITEKTGTGKNLLPNPFTDQLTVHNLSGEASDLTLFNVFGQIIYKERFLTSSTFSTQQITKGIYIYELSNQFGTMEKGIIVKE